MAKYRSRLKGLRNVLPEITEVEELNLPNNLWDWSQKVRRIKKVPLTFEDREYLKQIYLDDAKELAAVKGRQTELTEYGVNWLLYCLSQNPMTIGLYTTDRFSHLREFSNIRIKQWALQDSEILQKLAPSKMHTVTLLPFSNGSILLMHSAFQGFEEARSIPADFAVVDERQSTRGSDLDILRQSLSKSKFGWIRIIGTGDIEESSWYKDWMEGTQYEWTKGQWVAKNPGAYIHSYHLPQQITPWFNEEESQRHKKRNIRTWTTEVLGWWYKGAKKPITTAEVRALFDKNIRMLNPIEAAKVPGWTVMGIDWAAGGASFTVPWIEKIIEPEIPISRLIYATEINERSTEKQADMMINLIEGYNVDQVVMDAGGGPRQVEKLEDRYGFRTTKCSYMTRPQNPLEQKHLDSENLLVVDRTWLLETQIDRITRPWPEGKRFINRIQLPGYDEESVEWIIDHFTSLEAKQIELTSGRSYTRYIHPPEQPDDAVHASGYSYLAWWLKKNKSDYPKDIGSIAYE